MKSLEYIFLGIPIVISKTKAHSYYYDDTMVTFFAPNDSKDLANKIIECYGSPAKMIGQVRNSINFIRANSWETAKDAYIKIVKELAA
jgi:glycosyltransferase involved in cell wall biosynthesis